jgi:hypothetical protein
MDKKAERLKALIKGNVKDRPTFGTDPNDPWSTKANISEETLEEGGQLDKYLLSKGINPKVLSLQTKISHSKSSEFTNWKNRQVSEDIETISEDDLLNAYLKTKGLNPKTASKISKIAASKTGDFEKWKSNHIRGGRLPVMKSEQVTTHGSPTLKRQRVLDRAFDKGVPISSPGLNKEEVDKKDTVTMDIPLLIRILELAREDVKTDAELHRVVEKLIDIRNKGTLTMDDYDFVAKLKESFQLEDTYQDSYAATQTVGPENYSQSTDDTETKKEPSNRVKVIKKIYKESRVNEDLYDHEKDEKSVESPRKKSTLEKLPNASAILTGGKTETGKPRDDIEIDPQMRMRPGNTGFPPQTQKKNNNK